MIALVFLVSLFFVPLISTEPYLLYILICANIYVVLAVSWDLLTGYTGQISLGHAAFFGVGAYTAAFLNLELGLMPWATIPIGGLGAVLMGLIVGIPALRLRGPYLALTTLALPIIITGIILASPKLTGGEYGLAGLTSIAASRTHIYYLSLLVMIGSVFIMWKLIDMKSMIRTGIIFRAISEDEITARAAGINTMKYKLLAFCISAFFAGIAGSFYAHFMRMAGPSTLEISVSFNAIMWTVFGGMATIYGPVAGVYILYPLLQFLWVIPEARLLIFAVLVIIVLLYMPEGIASWIRDKIEVECPRCKLINIATRRYCRACHSPLRGTTNF